MLKIAFHMLAASHAPTSGICPVCHSASSFYPGWRWFSLLGVIWLLPLGPAFRCSACEKTLPGSQGAARRQIARIVNATGDWTGATAYSIRARLANALLGQWLIVLMAAAIAFLLVGQHLDPWLTVPVTLLGWILGGVLCDVWSEPQSA